MGHPASDMLGAEVRLRIRNHLSFVIAAVGLLLSPPALLHAQNSPASETAASKSDSVPTFRASSRLVLVDVVATDKNGKFVHGLKATDFSVIEDGKPQRIAGFSAHVSEPVTNVPPKVQLPPNQYTNFSTQQPGHAISIVLLDMLNTPRMDQAYARKEMLKFLAAMPPGQTVALFALNSQLNMIQGFTSDSKTLVAAAESLLLSNSGSHLLTTEEERQNSEISAANAATAAVANAAAAAGRDPSQGAAASAILNALRTEEDFQDDVRVRVTLEGIAALARAVAGYPGRKNLLWLSARFPFRLDPEFNRPGQARYFYGNSDAVLETAALLAASQTAVYPIDVIGLETNGLSISAPSTFTGLQQGQIETATTRQVTARWDRQEAMSDLARETGGRPFYGSNDLKSAMLRSLQEGSNYYTVAYVPANSKWDGEYRKIGVKIARGGVYAQYRSGYYAVVAKEDSGNQAERMLVSAMQPTLPESTMLLLRVRVLPPDLEHSAVRIDYAVAAQDLSFTDATDINKDKNANIEFIAIAWDKNHLNAGQVVDTSEVWVGTSAFEEVMLTGFPRHQELELKPGSYVLRLGVIDLNSQKMGTVDVPLTIPPGDIPEK
jgi:VWFA-related protein